MTLFLFLSKKYRYVDLKFKHIALIFLFSVHLHHNAKRIESLQVN